MDPEHHCHHRRKSFVCDHSMSIDRFVMNIDQFLIELIFHYVEFDPIRSRHCNDVTKQQQEQKQKIQQNTETSFQRTLVATSG